jgi:ABC-type multidrug transport system ATPase subunit
MDDAAATPAAATPAEAGIGTRGVTRTFGAVQALAGVDLDARPGAVTALVGPNGSGKTTLLLILAGLLTPDSGTVRVAGHDPVADGPAARALTGWMPDAFGTWDSLTAREVLATFADAYRLPPLIARDRVASLLSLVHLEEYADRPASVLSRGQKQRLGLARSLVNDPRVLLLDEPAAGLDPRSRVDLRQLVRRLADEGRTVLISSHVLSELEEMADDAVFISRGRNVPGTALESAVGRRTWHVTALRAGVLRAWLTSVGAAWRPDDDSPVPSPYSPPVAPAPSPYAPPPAPGAPVPPESDGPGGVFLEVDGDEGAARLVRDAVAAGVPLVSLAPAGGALEQAYLALEEERR